LRQSKTSDHSIIQPFDIIDEFTALVGQGTVENLSAPYLALECVLQLAKQAKVKAG
jgi:hypothetical protein